jgi:tetratricopeptide (TPR) repeat protein
MDLTIFDVDELLHLAIKLTSQEKYVEALSCLKRAAKLEPMNGTLLYFIGLVYAHLDMYERSLATMERAVQLDPQLNTAHFQIGLLYFTSNRLTEAIKAWRPLEALEENDPLLLFKTGLEALARDDFDSCRDHLAQGIARNPDNAAINADMGRILERIHDRTTAQADALASGLNGVPDSRLPF